jgi:hypothetical protein
MSWVSDDLRRAYDRSPSFGGATSAGKSHDVVSHIPRGTGNESGTSETSYAPLIKFGRYVNKTLELFDARTNEVDYVVFSHVWGKWTPRSIRGIPYQVKASQEKADFIENDLPSLVGDGAFWMDTLTVDQWNEEEVLAIVDVLPIIFRMAKKTIAVRECDGLYNCCMNAVEGFNDNGDFQRKIFAHASKHSEYTCAETYLQRLWTLQECLLSHTIEFTVGCNSELFPASVLYRPNLQDNPKTKSQRYSGIQGAYHHQADLATLTDALWVLAYCVSGADGPSGITEFFKAYVHGGTVINSRSLLKEDHEDIHTGNVSSVNSASHRSATMPRDYIFATMTAFPWYKFPKKAIELTFGEIYLDLYGQASACGHAFTCKFTRSMIEGQCTDPITGWLPNPHLPSPTTLGDFLKLVGHRVADVPNAEVRPVHLTSIVLVQDFECHSAPELVISTIQSCMKRVQQQWQESHLGGELSKFGNFPSDAWTLDGADAARCGWNCVDRREKVRVLETGDDTLIQIGPGLEYEEDDLIQDVYDLTDTETYQRTCEADGSATLFTQARKILDHLWCATDPVHVNPDQKADWNTFKRDMRASWSTPLLRTMLLLAAMVNCRVPLSATAWVNKLFVPVYVQYGESLITIGLLAKHARQSRETRKEPLTLLSVGQHLDNAGVGNVAFGKDLFLVDARTKVPVGLLPDIMHEETTDVQHVKMVAATYTGFCQILQGDRLAVVACPLSAVQIRSTG